MEEKPVPKNRKIGKEFFEALDDMDGKPPSNWEGYSMYGEQNKHKLGRVASSYLSGFNHVRNTTLLNPSPLVKPSKSRPSSAPPKKETPKRKYVPPHLRSRSVPLEDREDTEEGESKLPKFTDKSLSKTHSKTNNAQGVEKRRKKRRKKRTKRKKSKKLQKGGKRKTRGKKNLLKKLTKKCVKFFRKKHKVTQKKALKMCKKMFK